MRSDTKNIVATIAFLIGIRKSAWVATYGNECFELLDTLENNKNAVIIYSFIENSYKTVLVVDCENSDVYKLYGMLKNLKKYEIEKIHKIILFDDDHTNNGWISSQSRILCKRKTVQIKKYMMRPIVIAVGLICILAHDYLIVKIKMLFRYSVTIVCCGQAFL